MKDKKADLAGPGIGNYEDLTKILPDDYKALLTPMDTQKAVHAVKTYIEENLCKELNLQMDESVDLLILYGIWISDRNDNGFDALTRLAGHWRLS